MKTPIVQTDNKDGIVDLHPVDATNCDSGAAPSDTATPLAKPVKAADSSATLRHPLPPSVVLNEVATLPFFIEGFSSNPTAPLSPEEQESFNKPASNPKSARPRDSLLTSSTSSTASSLARRLSALGRSVLVPPQPTARRSGTTGSRSSSPTSTLNSVKEEPQRQQDSETPESDSRERRVSTSDDSAPSETSDVSSAIAVRNSASRDISTSPYAHPARAASLPSVARILSYTDDQPHYSAIEDTDNGLQRTLRRGASAARVKQAAAHSASLRKAHLPLNSATVLEDSYSEAARLAGIRTSSEQSGQNYANSDSMSHLLSGTMAGMVDVHYTPPKGSSKAAAMLGISPQEAAAQANNDVIHRDFAGFAQQQQHRQSHQSGMYDGARSAKATSPSNMSFFSSGSEKEKDKDGKSSSSTLKKARSLFSSSSNKSSNKSYASGVYGDAPPLPMSNGDFSSKAYSSGSPGKAAGTLKNSKSHGSLGPLVQGNGASGYRNISAPLPQNSGNPVSATSTYQSIVSTGSSAYDAFYPPVWPARWEPSLIDQYTGNIHRVSPQQTQRVRKPSSPLMRMAEEAERNSTTHHSPSQVAKSQRSLGNGSVRNASSTSPREEDANCPICHESLSLRMAGEKPHVVPVCGHKLHADCFEVSYGVTGQQALRDQEKRKYIGGSKKASSLGVCGICRGEMRVSDEQGSGKNKFAALAGQVNSSPTSGQFDTIKSSYSNGTADDYAMRPGFGVRGRSASAGATIVSNGANAVTGSLHDPNEDQDIVSPNQHLPAYMQHIALGAQNGFSSSPIASKSSVVMPKITVRAENKTITRPLDPEKRVHLTCMVTIEVPARSSAPIDGQRARSRTLNTIAEDSVSHHQLQGPMYSSQTANGRIIPNVNGSRRESNATSGTEDFPASPSVSAFSNGMQPYHGASGAMSHAMDASISSQSAAISAGLSPQTHISSAFTTPGSVSAASFSTGHAADDGFSRSNASTITLTANVNAAQDEKAREAHGPFGAVFEDLVRRMADWKGHQPATSFGSLRMFDNLQVRKDRNVRDFVVYLFEEVLLCVVDDRKKAGYNKASDDDKLRLKGRVFVKHMRSVEDTSSVAEGLSLTIHMEDDTLDSFVILFATRESLEHWRLQIQALVDHHRPPLSSKDGQGGISEQDADGRRDSNVSATTSQSGQTSLSRGTKATTAPSTSGSGKAQMSPIPAPEQAVPPLPSNNIHQSSIHLQGWTSPDPVQYTPLDLMLVLSVPSAASTGPSNSGLKLRLLRSALDFIVHSVGPRARICVVAYTAGDAATGCLKKTPWLATGRADGLKRLEQAIVDLTGDGSAASGSPRRGEGVIPVDAKEERITVASAVNLALDIILQRQVKSATSGMILLNDGKDGAQKAHIEMLNARIEAGRVPIHAFGWGRGHDPSSLWLLSNHSKGSYTFVRDFYQLKESLAGCIGGMLSVAIASLKLHLNVQERRWFRIRKVAGIGSAIVSSDGKDVDIALGEMRHGEKKEMLIEIEFGAPRNSPNKRASVAVRRKPSLTATDDFFIQRLGVDPNAFSDVQDEFYDEIGDTMADDVPIFEVNATFHDPTDDISRVLRTPYPALLTTTVLPPTKTPQSPPSPASNSAVSDASIVRRRMELLTSDMITRTLLLMSRHQEAQAQRLLVETVRIFEAIIANLIPAGQDAAQSSVETIYAVSVLGACLEDVEQLKAGCADREEFENVTRNFGAQQAVALRDQRAWTNRSLTEALFFNAEWLALFGKTLSNISAY